MPRFGHGTFLHCLESVYRKLSGNELEYCATVGKPSALTYLYAESQLRLQADTIGLKNPVRHLYAIG
jgi:ribonucleotide monophosphatase NagD (HAD superfamily)